MVLRTITGTGSLHQQIHQLYTQGDKKNINLLTRVLQAEQ